MTARLPQLSRRAPPPPTPDTAQGWFALARERVVVPTIEDARGCAGLDRLPEPCRLSVIAIDPPHGTVIVSAGSSGSVQIRVDVRPGLTDEQVPTLDVAADDANNAYEEHLTPQIVDACRTRLHFEWALPAAEGDYTLALSADPATKVTVALDHQAPHRPPFVAPDRCAITLAPGTHAARIANPCPPDAFPRPPLLSIDRFGCIVPVWDVHGRGWALAPVAPDRVQLWQSCRGGVIVEIAPGFEVRDAVFWGDEVAVLGPTSVHVFDKRGCEQSPTPLFDGLTDAIGLAVSDLGWLVVIHRPPPNSVLTNVVVLRRDGTRVLEAAAFDGRGWYARQRNAALAYDESDCAYWIEPARIGEGCCVDERRRMTADEALFFELVDDLPHLRQRVAYPHEGEVILGPALPEDPLDAGRPGSQWHRIVILGDIPSGCAIDVETRAYDDIVAGDPLVPGGWSRVVTATAESRTTIQPPHDDRRAAADAAVLAPPGRHLWVRLRLRSNGRATPRITGLELTHPRRGIARLLPQVFQRSTPEDDFLRRWLALFETTAFDGVADLVDAYHELFDPRTAPARMLPFLAQWLQILALERWTQNLEGFRRALVHADALARGRGTVDGLRLAVRLYMGLEIHVVETYAHRGRFVLGCGTTIDGVTGPILGCETTLTAELSPVWLGDEPRLGCGFLLECDERTGALPYHFDVWVAERDVCRSEDLALLRRIIELEKPAHTTFRLHQFGSAGWVVGRSVLGEAVSADFDRLKLDPATYGIAIANGPPRPKPLDHGFALGIDSRLHVEPGQPPFRITATLGATTRVAP